MLRAIAAYLLALPVVALAFWCINAWLYPPAQPTPLLALVFSATYFAPLLLVLGLPGLAILVAWCASLGSRAWPISAVPASAAVLATFAYSNNVMCRVSPMSADCFGSIGYQLTDRSPFGGEYTMIFWSTAICSVAFWRAFRRSQRDRGLSSDAGPTKSRTASDA